VIPFEKQYFEEQIYLYFDSIKDE